MSTPNSHQELQQRVWQNFNELLERFQDGGADFDEVEDCLQDMIEDDEIDAHTYETCRGAWEHLQAEDAFWQKEDREMWKQLED